GRCASSSVAAVWPRPGRFPARHLTRPPPGGAEAAMRWACILLPQLAMDGVLRQRADADAPLALLAGPPQRRRIQAVNAAARALGLKPGQSLTAAQALSQDFATAEYDLASIERWQQLLAAWAYTFSAQ